MFIHVVFENYVGAISYLDPGVLIESLPGPVTTCLLMVYYSLSNNQSWPMEIYHIPK